MGLLDEWASRFFEELDYVREGSNATRFAADMAADLPQIVVPKTYSHLTQRRVLTSQWLDGEKLSQSTADDVGELVSARPSLDTFLAPVFSPAPCLASWRPRPLRSFMPPGL